MGTKRLSQITLMRRAQTERRSEIREKVSLSGTASYGGESFPARVRDLSPRGGLVVVEGGFWPTESKRILLTLERPAGTFRIQAEVRHGRPIPQGGHRSFELGLLFHKVARAIPSTLCA